MYGGQALRNDTFLATAAKHLVLSNTSRARKTLTVKCAGVVNHSCENARGYAEGVRPKQELNDT